MHNLPVRKINNTLYLHKINLAENKKYCDELKKQFETVENYFDMSGKIVIGERLNYNKNSHSQPSINPPISRRTSKKIKLQQNESLNKLTERTETLDHKQIKNLFEQFKFIERENNSSLTLNKYLKNLPKRIKKQLNIQERSLKARREEEIYYRTLSKHLCKKSKKKEDQLLLNRIENFRLKRELITAIPREHSSTIPWIASLRRPSNFTGTRKMIINIGTHKNPFYSVFKEKYPETHELTLNPDAILESDKNNNRLNKEYLLKTISSFQLNRNTNFNINKLENLHSMMVNGKNLLSVEYNNALSMKGKVCLMQNKDKCINSNYKKETIISNYSNNIGRSSVHNTHIIIE